MQNSFQGNIDGVSSDLTETTARGSSCYLQADVDQNELDADAAITAESAARVAGLATKLDLTGGTLTGSLVVHRQFLTWT